MYLSILFLQQAEFTCTGCFWCWAGYLFLSAIIGLIIGKWIWGNYANVALQKEMEIKVLKEKNSQLEKDYIQVKYQFEESEKDNKGLKSSLSSMTKEINLLSNQLIQSRKSEQVKTIPNQDQATNTEVPPQKTESEKPTPDNEKDKSNESNKTSTED